MGPKEQCFMVHKNIICRRSRFFEAACAKKWTKPDKKIRLPEDEPDAFAVYLECVYNQPQIVENEDQQDDEVTSAEWAVLFRTYILADKYGDLPSANNMIDRIMKRSDEA